MKITRQMQGLLVAVVMLAMSSAASAGVFISVNFGPPALPVYEQPPCPAEGYMWTPGYWAYGPYGYYWVPGTWVLAPQPGYLWTPGYWAWGGGLYYWHPGYWGPHVGYYGGIPYGYGYTGAGYYGGEWRGDHFYYNQTVNNVNVVNVHNVYNTTVINNTTTVNRVSYNGGPGGIVARPTAEEEVATRETHLEPTPAQLQHQNTAQSNPQLRASVNQGRPPIAATAKPAEFSGHGVVAAKSAGAPYRAPAAANNVPRPGNNVPRPGNNPQPQAARDYAAPRSVPRPPSSYQPAMTARENESRTESAPRTENVPRPETAPRASQYESAPHPENAPRPQTAAPRGYEAHPQAAPHPEAQPRSEEPRRDTPPR